MKGLTTRFRINQAFGGIAEYLLNIDSNFSDLSTVIQNRRNDIRMDHVNGFRLVIKCFKGMYWPNRLAYSFVRKSKAQRSFETSLRLQDKGFRVPMPVAYIDYYKFGILQSSYFISLHVQHEDFQTALMRYSSSHHVGRLFAGFTFQLHHAGICHDDFSKGNVLCVLQENRIHFALVDLNRVRFQRVSYRAGLRSISKLGIVEHHLEEILRVYAELWGKSFSEALRLIQTIQRSRSRTSNIRKILKQIFFPSRVRRDRQGDQLHRAKCYVS